MKVKGYIITGDALISLGFVLVLMLGFIGIQYSNFEQRGTTTFERLHSTGENAIDTVNKMGGLEEIGFYWSQGDEAEAMKLTQKYFDDLIPGSMGYRLEAIDDLGNHTIYSSEGTERPVEIESSDKTRSYRLISGYKTNASRSGWTARAWLEEENKWTHDRVWNTTICCGGYTNYVAQYNSVDDRNNIVYIMIPGDTSLVSGMLNLTWKHTPTTATSSTSTTTTTTTTTTLAPCNACPVNENCEVGNWYRTSGDIYHYHNFTIPAGTPGGGCRINVTIYSSKWLETNPPVEINPYDIYVNWDIADACQWPPNNPQLWGWDCTTYPISGIYRTCQGTGLMPGEYTFMVDCWNPNQAYDLCTEDYYVYITSPDAGCPNYSPPTTSSTTSSTTTTTSTTLAPALLGAPCSDDDDCVSDNCASDYDGVGRWCAPADNCVHQPNVPNIVGRYYFNGNALDSVGTHNGITSDITYNPGISGESILFNGVSSYVTLGNNWGLTDKTISMWFRTDNSGMLIGHSGVGAERWGLVVEAGGNLKWYTWGTGPSIAGSTNVMDGAWHHVVVSISDTFDETNIYVDGILDATSSAAISQAASNNLIYLGTCIDTIDATWCTTNGIDGYFGGHIDELEILEAAVDATNAAYLHKCTPNCYGFVEGDFGTDCIGADKVYVCGSTQSWSSNVDCDICFGGAATDTPCAGVRGCIDGDFELGPVSAQCTGNCPTQGDPCDYCGNPSKGNPGADTYYDAVCDADGVCAQFGQFECAECTSCEIVGATGTCNYLYASEVEDFTDTNVCENTRWCDGAGNCIDQPVLTCSPRPKAIAFDATVCPATTVPTCLVDADCNPGHKCDGGVCYPFECADNGGTDLNHVRLSRREYISSQNYFGTFTDGLNDHWDGQYGWWFYGEPNDDEISIGVWNSQSDRYTWVHHGSYFDFGADIGATSNIAFEFFAMPESNCPINIEIYHQPTSQLLGSCQVGNTCDGSMNIYNSNWNRCTINVDPGATNVVEGTENIFRVQVDFSGTTACGMDGPCVIFFDAIQITCSQYSL